MADFLTAMAASSRERCAAAQSAVPLAALRARLADLPAPSPLVLHGFDLIAEVKRISPAEGALAEATSDADAALTTIADRAALYEKSGAALISVLTEPSRFGGDLTHLRAAAQRVRVPVMRKDFLVDPYQVTEARAHGASAVLLIVRILDDAALSAMLHETHSLGMHALVEAFDAEDLSRAANIIALHETKSALRASDQPKIMLGLNCRDLSTLRIDPARFAALAGCFPAGILRVAESGVHSPADAASVASLGYHAALVGTALMRCPEPGTLTRAMIEAGCAAAPPCTLNGSDPR